MVVADALLTSFTSKKTLDLVNNRIQCVLVTVLQFQLYFLSRVNFNTAGKKTHYIVRITFTTGI